MLPEAGKPVRRTCPFSVRCAGWGSDPLSARPITVIPAYFGSRRELERSWPFSESGNLQAGHVEGGLGWRPGDPLGNYAIATVRDDEDSSKQR